MKQPKATLQHRPTEKHCSLRDVTGEDQSVVHYGRHGAGRLGYDHGCNGVFSRVGLECVVGGVWCQSSEANMLAFRSLAQWDDPWQVAELGVTPSERLCLTSFRGEEAKSFVRWRAAPRGPPALGAGCTWARAGRLSSPRSALRFLPCSSRATISIRPRPRGATTSGVLSTPTGRGCNGRCCSRHRGARSATPSLTSFQGQGRGLAPLAARSSLLPQRPGRAGHRVRCRGPQPAPSALARRADR